MRPLASTDYRRGHLSVLSTLTSAEDPGEAAWVAHFESLRSLPRTYYTLVIVDKTTDMIVGVGTVFMERKFQRGLSSAGHIEDIVVDEKQQGKKLGLRIIQALVYISENSGAYKTILNCANKNIRESFVCTLAPCAYLTWPAFYQKCGFETKECEMVRYCPYYSAQLLYLFIFRRNMPREDPMSRGYELHR